MDKQPIIVWVLLLTAALGIPALTSAALYRGAAATGLGRRTATGVAGAFAAGWGGWLPDTSPAPGGTPARTASGSSRRAPAHCVLPRWPAGSPPGRALWPTSTSTRA